MRIGSWLRLGSLLLVTGVLMAALTLPAAATDTKCPRLWNAIEIVSVTAVEPVAVWHADDLLSYGDGRVDDPIPVGELDIVFTPLVRRDFDGYRVTATPSDDDPGTSEALEIDAQSLLVSHAQAQAAVRMNLEPGTKYYIEVVAVNLGLGDTAYILSEAQGNQDDMAATTWLSPPFLGAYTDMYRHKNTAALAPSPTYRMDLPNTANAAEHQGTHFLVYKLDQELHSFRWLNPEVFGPYDHVWKEVRKKGADILCTDSDGVVDECPTADTDRRKKWDINTYRVQVARVGGGVEYQQDLGILSLPDEIAFGVPIDHYYYEAFFHLDPGAYDFSVQAGRKDGTVFRAMSGKAVVRFDITADYLRYNQSIDEWVDIIHEIAVNMKEDEDRDRWFNQSRWNHYGDYISKDTSDTSDLYLVAVLLAFSTNPYLIEVADAADAIGRQINRDVKSRAIRFIAHLNNIYD